MSIVSQEQFAMLKFSYKDFFNIKRNYKKFHDINSKKYLAVCKQDLYGILDIETEKLIIPFKYQKVCDFKENFAWVKAKNKWGFINSSLKEIVSPKFSDVFGLDNGNFELGIINCVGTPQFLDEPQILMNEYKKNRKVNPSIVYNRIEGFSEGLTPIKYRRKWGFINKLGEMVIKPRFDSVKPFSYGLAAVYLDSKWGFINRNGNMVIKNKYSDCSSFMKPSVGLTKKELKRPTSNKIMNYIYSVLTKVHVNKIPTVAPFAQVELPCEDQNKIKLTHIDTTGNLLSKSTKKDIEVHAVIY